MLRFRRRRKIFDDEDALPRLDQPELPARDFFYGSRILAEASDGFAKAGIFGALLRDRRGQLVVLVSGAHDRQKPALADQRVDDDHARDEDQQGVHDAAGSSRRLRRRTPALLRRARILFFCHVLQTLQQFQSKVQER